MCSGNDPTKIGDIPPRCQSWRILSMQLPRFQILGGLDISLTIFTALVFTAVRQYTQFVMAEVYDWPAESYATKTAAASFVSIVHSMNLVPALGSCFRAHPFGPSESLSVAPRWWQETVTALLQFCTGYMLYDAAHILWNTGWKVDFANGMFLAHHAMTIFYMTATRVYGAGHQSAMMCMFLGEVTNPLHNAYFAGVEAQALACCSGRLSQLWLQGIELTFGISYCFVRVILGPAVMAYVSWDLVFRKNPVVPWWMIAIWIILIWGVILGSIPFIVEYWNMTLKYLPPSVISIASLL